NRNSDDVSVLLGRGDGTFEEQRRFAVGDRPYSVQVADVNGDGQFDLVTNNRYSGDVSVLLGRGDGTFEDQLRFDVGEYPFSVQVADMNGDG
ncbi:VCBS repeat-containing protein, partial [Pseudoalteromonas sp. CR1]|uniref:FG-GAP repeat domain-containing protein n=1 Tax=Pseudoalteromonas sp. CR1 TaxID=2861964 RepID=UPI001C6031A4